jgi:hypothetical protein
VGGSQSHTVPGEGGLGLSKDGGGGLPSSLFLSGPVLHHHAGGGGDRGPSARRREGGFEASNLILGHALGTDGVGELSTKLLRLLTLFVEGVVQPIHRGAVSRSTHNLGASSGGRGSEAEMQLMRLRTVVEGLHSLLETGGDGGSRWLRGGRDRCCRRSS